MLSTAWAELVIFLNEQREGAIQKILYPRLTTNSNGDLVRVDDDVDFGRGFIAGIDEILKMKEQLEKVDKDLIQKAKEQYQGK